MSLSRTVNFSNRLARSRKKNRRVHIAKQKFLRCPPTLKLLNGSFKKKKKEGPKKVKIFARNAIFDSSHDSFQCTHAPRANNNPDCSSVKKSRKNYYYYHGDDDDDNASEIFNLSVRSSRGERYLEKARASRDEYYPVTPARWFPIPFFSPPERDVRDDKRVKFFITWLLFENQIKIYDTSE